MPDGSHHDPEDLLTRSEAAAFLRTSEAQIRRAVQSGDLRERFANGRALYRFQDLLDFVEHRTHAAGETRQPAPDNHPEADET
jgi:hypothetical protein